MSQQNHRLGMVVRAALLAGAAVLAGCSAQMPDVSQFKLPNPRSFLPENADSYVPPPSAKAFGPVGPGDLVDAQGFCAGGAPAPVPTAQGSDTNDAPAPPPSAAGPALPGPVGLDMTECEVVRALGQPQSVNLSANERGERKVAMTFIAADRSGTYQFVGGRLVSLERGPEPPPPPKPEKPAKKKSAKKPPPKVPAT
jgi:hypothetical protein